jgi:RNA polymerase sigma factor (sigma-70 family)
MPFATTGQRMELTMESALASAAAPNQTARLTRLMQRGDEEAYREFFTLYFHRLLAYLLVVTRGNESLARDLVQQTMIKVAKHIRVFNEEAALWRWVALLARTSAMDEGRKAQRYLAFLERWWRRAEQEPDTSQSGEFDELLSEGLEQLEAEDRLILEKKYFDKRSVREIAAELEMSEKAVESRLSRIRAKLKATVLKGLSHE